MVSTQATNPEIFAFKNFQFRKVLLINKKQIAKC